MTLTLTLTVDTEDTNEAAVRDALCSALSGWTTVPLAVTAGEHEVFVVEAA